MKDPDDLKQVIESLGPGYRFIRELGRGATAIVYLVEDTELERDLAIKIIRSSFIHDEEALARLQREARLVAKLQHPNIVKLFDTRHLPDGSMALLMEHVPGRNLKEVIQDQGPFRPVRALGMLKDVASALAYAHRRRIVHRDVKPENIYVDEEVGNARLADFGVARPWDRDARLTLPGESLGTPAYMSPEQIDAEEVDGRTDVYSLGLVGYEMLAGRHPWEAENLYSIIFKQKNEKLPPLPTIRSDLPPPLVSALQKALRKDPKERWASADEFLECLEGIDIADSPDPFFEVLDTGGGGGGSRGGAVVGEIHGAEVWRDDEAAAPGAPTKRRRVLAFTLVPLLMAGAAVAWMASRPDGLRWINRDAEGTGADPATALETPTTLPADSGLAPGIDPPTPTLMVAEGGDQEGTVGQLLPDSVQLEVTDPEGGPLVGASIALDVLEGTAGLPDGPLTTDSLGRARFGVQLPDQPARVVMRASLDGTDSVFVDIVALASPGAPSEVVPVSGDGQTATAGQSLPASLGVRVIDELGNAVPGVEVRFNVLEGDGRITPAVTNTDANGRATASWRLGDAEGRQRAEAVVPAAGGSSQIFQATAEAAAPIQETPPATDPTPTVVTAPPPSVSRRAFAVGGSHVCALDSSGFTRCRGSNDRGQGEGGRGTTFRAIAAGVSHTCGLDAQGRAYCWGRNDQGQLGIGTRGDRRNAVPVEGDVAFSTLVAGAAHTCGLDGLGRAFCWGANTAGQVGDQTHDNRLSPRSVSTDVRFRSLAAGWNHTCGIAQDGRAHCWGLNTEGQLGDGSGFDRTSPVSVSSTLTFSEIAAGNVHTCGRAGGDIYCWGANTAGQLGDGSGQRQTTPVRVPLPGPATRLVTGAVHGCVILDTGVTHCWGLNVYGQLGDGTTTSRPQPVPVLGNLRFTSLEAGGSVTCGVRGDGEEYCWGMNQDGQLGDGTRINQSRPTPVGG